MIILVRGAGDIASAVIVRLFKAGFPVLALETAKPTVIRRTVSLADAVYEKEAVVEGVRAVLSHSINEALSLMKDHVVPVLVDENMECLDALKPSVIVDAIMAKRNTGFKKEMAELTIALGPGFTAGVDADYVIETKRGHNLGRIIEKGRAEENTNIPGSIEGFTFERVIHSPSDGVNVNLKKIGDIVKKGDVIMTVGQTEVKSKLDGMLRGLIRDKSMLFKGEKIADVDPRGEKAEYLTISDKARCISGSVLELVCAFFLREI